MKVIKAIWRLITPKLWKLIWMVQLENLRFWHLLQTPSQVSNSSLKAFTMLPRPNGIQKGQLGLYIINTDEGHMDAQVQNVPKWQLGCCYSGSCCNHLAVVVVSKECRYRIFSLSKRDIWWFWKVEFKTFCSKTGLTPPTPWAVVFNFNDVLYSIGTKWNPKRPIGPL